MKLDYKPKMVQTGSFFTRRRIHILLGAAACLCFGMGFKPATVESSAAVAIQSTAIPLPELSFPKIASTNAQAVQTPLRSGTSSPQPSLDGKTTNAPLTVTEKTVTDSSQKVEDKKTENKIIQITENQVMSSTENKITLLNEWQTVKVRQGDTLAKIFKRLGLQTKDLNSILEAEKSTSTLASLQSGQTLKLCFDKTKQVQGLSMDIAPGDTLQIKRHENAFKVEHKKIPLEKQIAFGKGAIKDSLFSAAKRAGLNHKIVNQMVEIFGWNIDFSLDLQPNDTFKVLYEEKRLDGEKIDTGHILAAEIINDGKKHLAIRYTDKAGHTGYFSPEGYGMHQAFLRNPVNFTRISSHFGPRKHPILHRLRAHNGVDYSAPKGTPVQSTGDGKIIFMGRRGGYGNLVEIQHGPRYTTVYAHLSGFAKKLRVNQEIKQGTIIGYVGATGLATGPHLHYEFRIDGIHRNPLTVALPRQKFIPNAHKSHFLAHAKEMIRLMEHHENKVKIASNSFSLDE